MGGSDITPFYFLLKWVLIIYYKYDIDKFIHNILEENDHGIWK